MDQPRNSKKRCVWQRRNRGWRATEFRKSSILIMRYMTDAFSKPVLDSTAILPIIFF